MSELEEDRDSQDYREFDNKVNEEELNEQRELSDKNERIEDNNDNYKEEGGEEDVENVEKVENNENVNKEEDENEGKEEGDNVEIMEEEKKENDVENNENVNKEEDDENEVKEEGENVEIMEEDKKENELEEEEEKLRLEEEEKKRREEEEEEERLRLEEEEKKRREEEEEEERLRLEEEEKKRREEEEEEERLRLEEEEKKKREEEKKYEEAIRKMEEEEELNKTKKKKKSKSKKYHNTEKRKKLKKKDSFPLKIKKWGLKSLHIMDDNCKNPRYPGFSEFISESTLQNSSYCWTIGGSKRFHTSGTGSDGKLMEGGNIYNLPSMRMSRTTIMGLGPKHFFPIIPGKGDPAPNAYRADTFYESTKKRKGGLSILGRNYVNDNDAKLNPGPGTYYPDLDWKLSTSRIPISVKSRQRFFYDDDIKQKEATVSMQKYYPKMDLVQRNRFRGISFGFGDRQPLYPRNGFPGPGSYNIPGNFDRGLKGKLPLN
jgi:hypothetical protein